MAAVPPAPERRRPRRGSLERPINGRLYRGTWLLVGLPLLVAAFSVAHPAPMMKAYIEVRSEGERLIRESGLRATILRPWYVLGPDHRWPYLLVPAYKLFEMLPSTRESAQRLGLVTLQQMINALLDAVENPSNNHHIVEVPEIRRL